MSDGDPLGTNPDEDGEVWLLEVDTGELTQVTSGGGSGTHSPPAISDDGTLLAFSSNRNVAHLNSDANREVFLFNTTTSTFTNLTTSTGGGNTANHSPEISGDGRTVAYLSNRNPLHTNTDGNTELFTLRRDTGVRRQVTTSTTGTVNHPSMDDRGTVVAFASDRNLVSLNADLSRELFTASTSTGAIQQRTQAVGGAGVQAQAWM